MASPWIQALRSVALEVADLAAAEAFYTGTWRLLVAHRLPGAIYLRGQGPDDHLLALHQGTATRIRAVTLRTRDAAALQAVAQAAVAAGGQVIRGPAALTPGEDPAGGQGLTVRDPDGRLYQLVHGDQPAPPLPADPRAERDRPLRLAHAVLNAHDVPRAQAFLERALAFKLADRTRIMAFMNCNADHHSLAFGDSDNDALNHIAFLMPDVDAVMRGGGRMKDAGFAIEWGPGRHGPGDNAFNYFVGPFGEVIEYTAEVEQVDDRYVARGPADWAWPPGRVDQWGISAPPSARLKEAQRSVLFVSTEKA